MVGLHLILKAVYIRSYERMNPHYITQSEIAQGPSYVSEFRLQSGFRPVICGLRSITLRKQCHSLYNSSGYLLYRLYLPFCLSAFCLCGCVCLSIYTSIYLYIYLSIHLFVYLFLCMSVSMSSCLSVCLSVYIFISALYFAYSYHFSLIL